MRLRSTSYKSSSQILSVFGNSQVADQELGVNAVGRKKLSSGGGTGEQPNPAAREAGSAAGNGPLSKRWEGSHLLRN